MKYSSLLLFCVFLLFSPCAKSQTTLSGWLADFNTVKLNTKLSIHSDFQLRTTDQLDHTQSLLLRAGLNYHVHKQWILTTGYAYIHNRRTVSEVTGYLAEHRIWEQAIFNHPLVLGKGATARKGSFQHRLRLEQRFIPRHVVVGEDLKKDGHHYANRLRYFFRNVNPIIPWSAEGKAPFLALQNEAFVNLGDKSAVNGEFFDQNRAYIALGYRFHRKFDAELGYMNQYTNGRGDAFTNNHIVQVATYVRL